VTFSYISRNWSSRFSPQYSGPLTPYNSFNCSGQSKNLMIMTMMYCEFYFVFFYTNSGILCSLALALPRLIDHHHHQQQQQQSVASGDRSSAVSKLETPMSLWKQLAIGSWGVRLYCRRACALCVVCKRRAAINSRALSQRPPITIIVTAGSVPVWCMGSRRDTLKLTYWIRRPTFGCWATVH